MTPRRIADISLVGLFLAGVVAYGGASAWKAVADRVEFATAFHRPWKTLPNSVENLIVTHLAARDALITWHGRLKAEWLGATPNPNVVLGRDGWLYFNHAAVDGYMSPHDQAFPGRLDRWAATLSARRAWLADRGIHYLIVAAPDKQSIYPEYLPRLNRRRGPVPLDDLLARCAGDPDLCVLDLRAPLRAARPAGPLYLHTDSHWTPGGCYASCAATVAALARWYPGLPPVPPLAFSSRPMQFGGGDLARMIGLTGRRSETVMDLALPTPRHARTVDEEVSCQSDVMLDHVTPRVWVNDAPGLPRVVLLGDSFAGDGFCSLLAEHCSRLVRVGSYNGQEALIERERPDLVVFEFVERNVQSYVLQGPR